MGKYVVKKTGTGIKFDLKAGNGEIIANSEVYSSKVACMNGIESVKTNAPIAAVEDQLGKYMQKRYRKVVDTVKSHVLQYLYCRCFSCAGHSRDNNKFGKHNDISNFKKTVVLFRIRRENGLQEQGSHRSFPSPAG